MPMTGPAMPHRDTAVAVEPTTFGRLTDEVLRSVSVVPAAPSSRGSDELSVTSELPPMLMPMLPERGEHAHPSVLFDPGTDQIIACTMGFTSLLGPLEFKSSFREIVANGKEFVRWVGHRVNELMNSDSEQSDPDLPTAEQLDIWIVMPTLQVGGRKFEFHAKACMVEAKDEAMASAMGVNLPGSCADEPHEILCILGFRDVHAKWRDKKKKMPKRTRATSEPRQVVLFWYRLCASRCACFKNQSRRIRMSTFMRSTERARAHI